MSDMGSSPFYIDTRGIPLKVLRANGKVKLISSCDDAYDFMALKGIHSHFSYEIFFVTRGTLELVTEEQTFVYEKKIVIIPPRFHHYSFPHGEGCFCLLFTFEHKEGENNISEGVEEMLGKGICELPLSEDIAFYIRKVSEKNNEQTEAAEKDAELLTTLIFGEIMQCFIPHKSALQKVKGSDSKHIYAIERYINCHVNERICLSDVATYTYLSTRQVSRIVRLEYGCTLGDLVKDKKLAVAKMLLKNTNMKVSEIAVQVNVGTENYFYYLFSRKYGMSPIQYRKKKRGILQ